MPIEEVQEVVEITNVVYNVLEETNQTLLREIVNIPEVLENTYTELIEVGVQGPPWPPGSGGGGSYEQVLETDYTQITYAYVGYASRISRIDYSVSPPNVLNSIVSDLNTSWSNRYFLSYS